MFLRVAMLVAAAGMTAALGSAAPAAYAETQDEQFLHLVRTNGVAGQDDSLIAFAHEFCDTNYLVLGTVYPLYGQGVFPGQIYTLKVAATRAYCPDKIASPPGQIYTGLG